MNCWGSSEAVPTSTRTHNRPDPKIRDTAGTKKTEDTYGSLTVLEPEASDPTTKPGFQLGQLFPHPGEMEVIQPSPKNGVKFRNEFLDTYAPIPACNLSQFHFEPGQALMAYP